MIKINDTACRLALKYLQGVNIYQQSVKRHNTSHPSYLKEERIFQLMDVHFFPLKA